MKRRINDLSSSMLLQIMTKMTFLTIVLLISSTAYLQAQTYQLRNNDFSVWEGSGNQTHAKYWNSVKNGGTGSFASFAAQMTYMDDQEYPQNIGVSKSVRLQASEVNVFLTSIITNGSMTTGKIQVSSTQPTNSGNHTYTDPGNGSEYAHPISAIPDSIYFWARYTAGDSGLGNANRARMHAVVHAANKYTDPETNSCGQYKIADAVCNYEPTDWVQKRIPFTSVNDLTPAFIHITFTTNQTPGVGHKNDRVWIARPELVYNRRLQTLELDGELMANFDPDVTIYNIDVCTEVYPQITEAIAQSANINTLTIVQATAENPTATVTINHGGQNQVYTIHFNYAPVELFEEVSACQTYTWAVNGQVYTESGIFEHASHNEQTGCDEVATLNLTIAQPVITELTATGCESFTWESNGQTYNRSGNYTHVVYNPATRCEDITTLHLTIAQPVVEEVTVVACETYTWALNGQTYAESGDYEFVVENEETLCDDVTTLHLTITEPINEEVEVVACESYTWPLNGETYTESGVYTYTRLNDETQCEDVTTLHLMITEPVLETEIVTACETYTWEATGLTYNTTGTYEHVVYNETTLCEDVTTLQLTITEPIIETVDVVACETYTWDLNGQTYTASGDYEYVVENPSTLCDDITILHLTITEPVIAEVSKVACETYTWPLNGTTYLESGVYTYTRLNETTQCEDVATLNLTISEPVLTNETVVACETYTWAANGETYNTSGTYTNVVYNETTLCDDVATLELTITQPVITETSVIACDSYTWSANNETYTATGIYEFSTFNETTNCDDITRLHLTIHPSYDQMISLSVCESYTWNDETYTESGTYTQSFTSVNGCDSVVTLELTISNSIHNVVNVNACDQYFWPLDGQTYFETGDYLYIIENGNCLDTTTLRLTINQSKTNEFDAIACDSYTWNDAVYDESGVYTQTLATSNGCDSVVTLNLVVNHSTTNEISAVACDSYIWNEETYTQGGVYMQTFEAANACDSVVTLHLTINASKETAIEDVACETYTWNEQVYTESGVYSQTLSTINDCDSLVTLTLTITEPVLDTVTVLACETYTWLANNETYTESGIYNNIVRNEETLCDDMSTLVLTITEPVLTTITETACETYTWELNGETYTESGVYTHAIENPTSLCEDVTTLVLTITEPVLVTETASACETYTWEINGQTYTESGSYNYVEYNEETLCEDVTTLQLTITEPVLDTVIVTACETYTWAMNGETYTASGTYDYTMSNEATLCDDITTLELTISQPILDTVEVSACDTYTWALNNQTYTISGVYNYVTYNSITLCEDIHTLDLTINQSIAVTVNEIACNEYVWNDETYTTSGVYTQTFEAITGCDSVVTLNLSVNFDATNEISEVACDEYIWNDSIYTTSGMYTQTLQTSTGCDSVVTLNLTINNSVIEEVEESACNEFIWNDETFTESGEYSQTFAAANGCDSVVILHLTINYDVEVSLTDSVVLGGSYTDNGFDIAAEELTTVGEHTFTLTTQTTAGCDSIVTLNLFVYDNSDIADYATAKVSIYPNPATVVITIKADQIIDAFEIYSLTGQLMKKDVVNGMEKIINVNDLQTGVYMLRVISNGESVAKKMIINRN